MANTVNNVNNDCRERCEHREAIYMDIDTEQRGAEPIIARYECLISPNYGTKFDATCNPLTVPGCPCKG